MSRWGGDARADGDIVDQVRVVLASTAKMPLHEKTSTPIRVESVRLWADKWANRLGGRSHAPHMFMRGSVRRRRLRCGQYAGRVFLPIRAQDWDMCTVVVVDPPSSAAPGGRVCESNESDNQWPSQQQDSCSWVYGPKPDVSGPPGASEAGYDRTPTDWYRIRPAARHLNPSPSY